MKTPIALLTGHKGLLGATLLKADSGWKVIAVTGDISKKNTWNKLHRKVKTVDAVIHTAAKTNVDFCEKNQKAAYKTNVVGTQNALRFARIHGVMFVYISTSSVFSGKGNFKEYDLPYPKTYYDLTKYLGENACLNYEKSLIIRTNIIGIHPGGSRGENFAEWLLDSLKNNEDINLYTNVVVNPLSNWTLSEMIMELINKHPKGRIIHLGSRDHLSKAQIGKLFISKFKNFSGSINYLEYKSGSIDRSKNIWLNTRYAQEKLGLRMPSIRKEVERILKTI